MFRHVAKIINTDTRCVVLFMQIENRPDHALVVSMDNIPDHFERAVRTITESKEGQAATDLATVMGRRLMPDTGVRVLEALHYAGFLSAVHIDNIVMVPKPGMAFPLRQVIESIGGAKLPEQVDHAADKFNPHLHNQKMRSVEDRIAMAKNLMSEASDLRHLAQKKLDEAYNYAPELAPKAFTPEMSANLTSSPVVASVPLASETLTQPTASAADMERFASMMEGTYAYALPAVVDAPKKARAKGKTTKNA